MTTSPFWSVAVDAPLGALTYSIPEDLLGSVVPGHRVRVPLGTRTEYGVLLGPTVESTKFEIKPIIQIASEYPALPSAYLKWLEWLSSYYMHPLGEVTQLCYPPLERDLENKRKRSRKASVTPEIAIDVNPPKLSDEQAKIAATIQGMPGFQTHLLFGVTGSGKTEVYLDCLEKVLAEGKKGLVLVPEISLTPQLIQRFSRRFGGKIAVLHSHLTNREKTEQWWSMVEGDKQILIGARSALFCPVPNLGLIILDEEHEPSFKQEEQLKYHARDAAIVLARHVNCPVIMGSATPSLESWHNAKNGRYHLHELRHRIREVPMPEAQVVDLRYAPKSVHLPWMSQILFDKIYETLERGRQVALFLNRRGTAPVVICNACGKVGECPNCDISLTLHKSRDLICHYCNYYENYTQLCKECNENKVLPLGLGTEQVEEELKRIFPLSNIARADRDEIQNRDDLETLIARMESGDIHILIGTQMIAKGLDFPLLDLVGFVYADVGFAIPDFRTSERSFQLLTQMSGRAGRHATTHEERGQVVIQTMNPDHPALLYSLTADYEGFAAAELAHRLELGYPPHGRLAILKMSANDLQFCEDFALKSRARLRELQKRQPEYAVIEILGPAPAPIAKLRGRFRFQTLIKSRDPKLLHRFLKQFWNEGEWIPGRIKASIDIDPFNLI